MVIRLNDNHELPLCYSHMCHRGGKSTWPDQDSNPGPLAYCASTLDHWATEPHGRPVTISPCLIRFVSESARNHAWTDETVPLLLAAQAQTHNGHQMSQGRKKHMAQLGLEPRTSRIPCKHSDHWPTEPHSRPVTWHKQVFSWCGSYDIGLYSIKHSEEQSSWKLMKKCLTESGNMINLCMKFQDIFTRPKGILPDSVRHV